MSATRRVADRLAALTTALTLSGCGYNQFQTPGRADQGRLGRGAEPVPAPRRPDPEHRRHRQGRSQLRAGDADQGDRGARQGDLDPGHARDAEQPRGLQQVPAGAGRAGQRAVAPDGGQREVPEPEGQPGLPGPARAARGHREPHHRGAQPLHQDGARLQRARAPVPDQPDGDDLQLRGQAELHGRRTKRRSRRRRRSASTRRDPRARASK